MPPYPLARATLWWKSCVSLLASQRSWHHDNHTDDCSCCSSSAACCSCRVRNERFRGGPCQRHPHFPLGYDPSHEVVVNPGVSGAPSSVPLICGGNGVGTNLSSANGKIYPGTFRDWNEGSREEMVRIYSVKLALEMMGQRAVEKLGAWVRVCLFTTENSQITWCFIWCFIFHTTEVQE